MSGKKLRRLFGRKTSPATEIRDATIPMPIPAAFAGHGRFEVVTVAPDLLLAPDKRTRVYRREPNKTSAIEFNLCVDRDRSIDPKTGKQRFDLTPPGDVPPAAPAAEEPVRELAATQSG